MDNQLIKYGNYVVQGITNKYKNILNKLQNIQYDNVNILETALFQSEIDCITFAYILESEYQDNLFSEFQEEYCSIYKKELFKLLPLESIMIKMNKEDVYNFSIFFENIEIIRIFPYERVALILANEEDEQLKYEIESCYEMLEEVNEEIQQLEEYKKNPTLYSLDSNKMFAKSIFNKKSIISDIQEKLNISYEKKSQIQEELYNRQDYLNNKREQTIQKESLIKNIISRLTSKNIKIISQQTEEESVNREDTNKEINLNNYESNLKDSDFIINQYEE